VVLGVLNCVFMVESTQSETGDDPEDVQCEQGNIPIAKES